MEDLNNLIEQWATEGLDDDQIQAKVDEHKAANAAASTEEVEKLEVPVEEITETPAEPVIEEPVDGESSSQDTSSELPETEEPKEFSASDLPTTQAEADEIDLILDNGGNQADVDAYVQTAKAKRFKDIPPAVHNPTIVPASDIDAQEVRDNLGAIQTRFSGGIVKDADVEYLASLGVEVDRDQLKGSVEYYGGGFGTSRVEKGINHDYIDELVGSGLDYVSQVNGGKSFADVLTEQEGNEPVSKFIQFIDYIDKTEGERQMTQFEPAFQVIDILADIGRAVKTGWNRGQTTSTLYKLMGGESVNELEVQDYITNTKREQAGGQTSTEFTNFNKTYEEGGKDFYSFMDALIHNPTVIPEVVVSSLASVAGSPEAASAGIVGTAASGGNPVVGFAAASGTLETALSFGEFLGEELEEQDKGFTRANVRSVVEDKETLDYLKGKAITRGAIIGGIDLITGKLASSLGTKILAGKGLGRIGRKTSAALGVVTAEGTGGATGESLARLAVGQEQDIAEIGLEFFGEFGPGSVNVATTLAKEKGPEGKTSASGSAYAINGQPFTKQELTNFVKRATPQELLAAEINIVNDPILASVMNSTMDKAKLDNQIDPKVTGNDRVAAISIQRELNALKDNDSEIAKARKSELKASLKVLAANNNVVETPQNEKGATSAKADPEQFKEEKATIKKAIANENQKEIDARKKAGIKEQHYAPNHISISSRPKSATENPEVFTGKKAEAEELRAEKILNEAKEKGLDPEATADRILGRWGLNSAHNDTARQYILDFLSGKVNTPFSTWRRGKPSAEVTNTDGDQQTTFEDSFGDTKPIGAFVSPYYDTSVGSVEDAATLRKSPEYKQHKDNLGNIASTLNIEGAVVDETIGGYKFEDKEGRTTEISNKVNLGNATFDQARDFTILAAALAPEVQESSIAAQYVAEGTVGDNVFDEISLELSDSKGALEILEASGLDYTLNQTDNTVAIIDFANGQDAAFDASVAKLQSQLYKKGIYNGTKIRTIQSEFIDTATRTRELKRIAKAAKSDRQSRPKFFNLVQEAVAKNNQFINSQQDGKPRFQDSFREGLNEDYITPSGNRTSSPESTGVAEQFSKEDLVATKQHIKEYFPGLKGPEKAAKIEQNSRSDTNYKKFAELGATPEQLKELRSLETERTKLRKTYSGRDEARYTEVKTKFDALVADIIGLQGKLYNSLPSDLKSDITHAAQQASPTSYSLDPIYEGRTERVTNGELSKTTISRLSGYGDLKNAYFNSDNVFKSQEFNVHALLNWKNSKDDFVQLMKKLKLPESPNTADVLLNKEAIIAEGGLPLYKRLLAAGYQARADNYGGWFQKEMKRLSDVPLYEFNLDKDFNNYLEQTRNPDGTNTIARTVWLKNKPDDPNVGTSWSAGHEVISDFMDRGFSRAKGNQEVYVVYADVNLANEPNLLPVGYYPLGATQHEVLSIGAFEYKNFDVEAAKDKQANRDNSKERYVPTKEFQDSFLDKNSFDPQEILDPKDPFITELIPKLKNFFGGAVDIRFAPGTEVGAYGTVTVIKDRLTMLFADTDNFGRSGVKLDTLLHEPGHVLYQMMQGSNDPKLKAIFDRINETIVDTKEYVEAGGQESYSGNTEEGIKQEAFAKFFGRFGATELKGKSKKLVQAIKDLISYVKAKFGVALDPKTATLEDISRVLLSDLLSDKPSLFTVESAEVMKAHKASIDASFYKNYSYGELTDLAQEMDPGNPEIGDSLFGAVEDLFSGRLSPQEYNENIDYLASEFGYDLSDFRFKGRFLDAVPDDRYNKLRLQPEWDKALRRVKLSEVKKGELPKNWFSQEKYLDLVVEQMKVVKAKAAAKTSKTKTAKSPTIQIEVLRTRQKALKDTGVAFHQAEIKRIDKQIEKIQNKVRVDAILAKRPQDKDSGAYEVYNYAAQVEKDMLGIPKTSGAFYLKGEDSVELARITLGRAQDVIKPTSTENNDPVTVYAGIAIDIGRTILPRQTLVEKMDLIDTPAEGADPLIRQAYYQAGDHLLNSLAKRGVVDLTESINTDKGSPDYFKAITLLKVSSPTKFNKLVKATNALPRSKGRYKDPIIVKPGDTDINYEGPESPFGNPLVHNVPVKNYMTKTKFPKVYKQVNKAINTVQRVNTKALEAFDALIADGNEILDIAGKKNYDGTQQLLTAGKVDHIQETARGIGDNPFKLMYYYQPTGRMSPETDGINFQASKQERALTLLDQDEKIGKTGHGRLLANAVSNYGVSGVADLSIDGKIAKGHQLLPDFLTWAEDIVKYKAEIAKAKEPELFVADLLELQAATNLDGTPNYDYKSGIPIYYDAKNSGIQHYVGLTGDTKAAKWVNLLAGDAPNDAYVEINNKLEPILSQDRTAKEIAIFEKINPKVQVLKKRLKNATTKTGRESAQEALKNFNKKFKSEVAIAAKVFFSKPAIFKELRDISKKAVVPKLYGAGVDVMGTAIDDAFNNRAGDFVNMNPLYSDWIAGEISTGFERTFPGAVDGRKVLERLANYMRFGGKKPVTKKINDDGTITPAEPNPIAGKPIIIEGKMNGFRMIFDPKKPDVIEIRTPYDGKGTYKNFPETGKQVRITVGDTDVTDTRSLLKGIAARIVQFMDAQHIAWMYENTNYPFIQVYDAFATTPPFAAQMHVDIQDGFEALYDNFNIMDILEANLDKATTQELISDPTLVDKLTTGEPFEVGDWKSSETHKNEFNFYDSFSTEPTQKKAPFENKRKPLLQKGLPDIIKTVPKEFRKGLANELNSFKDSWTSSQLTEFALEAGNISKTGTKDLTVRKTKSDQSQADIANQGAELTTQTTGVDPTQLTPAKLLIEMEKNRTWLARVQTQGILGGFAGRLSGTNVDDFFGLSQRTLPKGGPSRRAFDKYLADNIFRPLQEAEYFHPEWTSGLKNAVVALKNAHKTGRLSASSGITMDGYSLSKEQAAIINAWSQNSANLEGMAEAGISASTISKVETLMTDNPALKAVADGLTSIFTPFEQIVDSKLAEHGRSGGAVEGLPGFSGVLRAKEGDQFYNKAATQLQTRSNSANFDITGKTLDMLVTGYADGPLRMAAFLNYMKNSDALFNRSNMDGFQVKLGKDWRADMENSMARVAIGRAEPNKLPGDVATARKWLVRSIGTTMFFNVRSFVTQWGSMPNFAFDNPGEYWKMAASVTANKESRKFIKETGWAQERGGGKTDVWLDELFSQDSKSKVTKAMDQIIQKGYFLTQTADKAAIVRGGAPYMSWRLKVHRADPNLTEAQAVEQAKIDFVAKADEAQQSSSQSRLGGAQATGFGKLVFTFGSSTLQFNRKLAKSTREIQAGKNVSGNLYNISAILTTQFAFFTAMQQAIDKIWDDDLLDDKKDKEKLKNAQVSMLSSIVAATGWYGKALASLLVLISKRDKFTTKKGKFAGYAFYNEVEDILVNQLAPVGTKLRLLKQAIPGTKVYKKSAGPLEVPDWVAKTAAGVEFLGVPAGRTLKLGEAVLDFGASDLTTLDKVRRLGWSRYDLQKELKSPSKSRGGGLKAPTAPSAPKAPRAPRN